MSRARAAIGLGSNLGDRAAHLRFAVEQLARVGDLVAVSSVYETAPIGPPQPNYLNAVAVLETTLGPGDLIAECNEIERRAGRERIEQWGPRTLDLDVLLLGDAVLDQPGATIPHPRMTERRFVLEPLLEVWPDASLPDGARLASFLPSVADQQVVEWVDTERALVERTLRSVGFLVPMVILILLVWWGVGWLIEVVR